VLYALDQKPFLEANVGNPQFYRECKSIFPCGSPLESTKGWEDKLSGNVAKAKEILKEAGYDGTPVVLLHQTDTAGHNQLATVAKPQLEAAGFKVDVQAMDWQTQVTRRTKKDPADKGGWNISMTAAATVLLSDPIVNHYTETTADRAQFGWPLDEEIEKLRMGFLHTSDPATQRRIAEEVQKRIMDLGVTVPLGQYVQPMARRKGVTGNIPSPVTVFWNVEKK